MLILLLICVGLAFFLQKILYKKYWNRRLEAQVSFEDSYAYEGDISHLREEITNDKILPLPAVEVRLIMDRSLRFTGEAKENATVTDKNYRRDIFSLFVHQKIIRILSFVCEKRGFYQVQDMELIGSDLLLREEYHETVPQQTRMYVYPKPVDVRRIQIICRAISGQILVQNRLYPDPFEFAGIREYRSTDPMRHINWKASARSTEGELMVNQFDSTTNISLMLFLDVEDAAILKQEDLQEESIRIAASLVSRLVKERMECKVISNGICDMSHIGLEETVLQMHLKDGGQLHDFYRQIACVNTRKRVSPVCDSLNRAAEKMSAGQTVILISKNQDEETSAAVRNICRGGSSVVWVIPLLQGNQPTVCKEANLQILPWYKDGV